MKKFVLVLFLGISTVFAEAVIYGSSDSGETWHRESSGCFRSLNAAAVDLVHGGALAVGDGGTILRRDAPGVWTDVSPPGLREDLRSVAIALNGVCMACGDNGALLSSYDFGATWRLWENFVSDSTDLLSVNFDPSSPSEFVITGDHGFVFSAARQGTVSLDTSDPVIGSCARFCSGYVDLVVTAGGSLVSLSGDSFPPLPVGSELNGTTPFVSAGGPFIIVGNGGLMIRMGDIPPVVQRPVAMDLCSVTSVEHGSVYCAVGRGGTILTSADNGFTWSRVYSGTSRNLLGVAGDGSGNCYIVGESILGRFLP